jgi:coenzyme F420-reducing hydrogenase gamma subunit
MSATKPKVAIFDFACCEGCQLQIVNLEENLIDLIELVTPVEWREAMSESSEVYDIAIVEGSITREEDAERLKSIRQKAKLLVALGACAAIGGVNKIKNIISQEDVKRRVYGSNANDLHLKTMPAKAVGEIVKVDAVIHGCPVEHEDFLRVIKALLAGKAVPIPMYPVCVECKKGGYICRYEKNEICLGPITRAGCGARCPSKGSWCFGCRGAVDEPNVNAAYDVMQHYGKTMADLKNRLILFGVETEVMNE